MPDKKDYFWDILDAARLAVSYISDKSYDDFLNDTQCQDAVIRRLEMIGEAANRIPTDIQAEYHQIPWKSIIAMRNFLIHKYNGIDLKIVWDTTLSDITSLISQLEEILE